MAKQSKQKDDAVSQALRMVGGARQGIEDFVANTVNPSKPNPPQLDASVQSPIPMQNVVSSTNQPNPIQTAMANLSKWYNDNTTYHASFNRPGAEAASPVTPTPTPNANDLQDTIQKGLQNYNPNAPIATMAAQLAEAGKGLPDPLLPTLIAMKESSGGKNITSGQNNIYNVLPDGHGVDYPDLQTAILGGNGQQGFNGVMKNGYYNDYLKSGNVEDFLKHFTPPGQEHGNADMKQQLETLKQLRSYFQK